MNNLKLYDLTIPQKSIYLTEEYSSGSTVNLIGGNIIIDETVNLDFLEKALNIFDVPVLYSEEEVVNTGFKTPQSIAFCPSIAGILIARYVILDSGS